MGDKPFADLAEARELLFTLHKQAKSSPDQSILRALEILLTDYIQRASRVWTLTTGTCAPQTFRARRDAAALRSKVIDGRCDCLATVSLKPSGTEGPCLPVVARLASVPAGIASNQSSGSQSPGARHVLVGQPGDRHCGRRSAHS